MDVVQRNFFRLLRSGTFGGHEPVEPMSAYKWNRLYQMALMHGVAALTADGIERHRTSSEGLLSHTVRRTETNMAESH